MFLCLSSAVDSDASTLKVVPDSVSLGIIEPGKIYSKVVTLSNTGTKDIRLKKVEVSCPCASVKVEDWTIQPGKSTALHIEVDTTGKSKGVQVTIFISLEGGVPTAIILPVTGDAPILKMPDATPSKIVFGMVRAGETLHQKLLIRIPENDSSEEYHLARSSNWIEFYEFKRQGQLLKIDVRVTVPNENHGPLAGAIVLQHPKRGDLRIPVSMNIASFVEVYPQTLFVVPTLTEYRIKLSSFSPPYPHVTRWEMESESIILEALEQQEDTPDVLICKIKTKEGIYGVSRGTLCLYFSDDSSPIRIACIAPAPK